MENNRLLYIAFKFFKYNNAPVLPVSGHNLVNHRSEEFEIIWVYGEIYTEIHEVMKHNNKEYKSL